jgi:hypothetical protein
LIAILLLKWLQHLSKARRPLSNLTSMLRLNLFTYRDLRTWLDDPFQTLLPETEQVSLVLAGAGVTWTGTTYSAVLFWTAVPVSRISCSDVDASTVICAETYIPNSTFDKWDKSRNTFSFGHVGRIITGSKTYG